MPDQTPEQEQFPGSWTAWPFATIHVRIEYEIHKDGRFEVLVFNPAGEIDGRGTGTWRLVENCIHWTYVACDNLPRPRRPQVDKIIETGPDRWILLEESGSKTELWRRAEQAETSANFDLDEVRPFLERLCRIVEKGFGETEVEMLNARISNLELDQSFSMIFPITYLGRRRCLSIHAFLDDINSPDISFHSDVDVVREIENEIGAFDPSLNREDHF